jgi:hypothetical protein
MRLSRRTVLRTLGASALAGASSSRGIRAAQSPITAYPAVAERLRRAADRRANVFSPKGIELNPGRGALALALDVPEIVIGKANGQALPEDGLLTFVIDVAETTYVSGALALEPATDSRPGLRVSVLCDDLLVGAPMVSATEWGVKEVTDAAPLVVGAQPSSQVPFATWLLRKGPTVSDRRGAAFSPRRRDPLSSPLRCRASG